MHIAHAWLPPWRWVRLSAEANTECSFNRHIFEYLRILPPSTKSHHSISPHLTQMIWGAMSVFEKFIIMSNQRSIGSFPGGLPLLLMTTLSRISMLCLNTSILTFSSLLFSYNIIILSLDICSIGQVHCGHLVVWRDVKRERDFGHCGRDNAGSNPMIQCDDPMISQLWLEISLTVYHLYN